MYRADVAVIGLGPTGLATALSCAALGLNVVCVEPLVVPSPEPRAASIDDVAQRLLARHCPSLRDLIAPLPVQLVSAGGALLFDVAPRVSSNGHPEVGFFFQPALEGALRAALARHSNVVMRLGWRATSVTEHAGSVRVVIEEEGTGAVAEWQCAFAVGCDGAASIVRRAAGLSLRGTTFTDAGSWLVVDAALPGHDSVRDSVESSKRATATHPTLMRAFRFVCDPARPGLDLPLPNGHARFEWVLDAREAVPDDATVCQWICARGVPERVARELRFTRKARYVFHARQAQPHWCSAGRRLLVAGDAAHLTPPMRGQGMSSGIADAANLSWKLWCIMRGMASLELMDTYERERHHRVVANTHIAVWLMQLVGARSRAFCAVRDAVMPLVTLTWPLRTLLFHRDAIVAGTDLVTQWRGPACDAPWLVGTLLAAPPGDAADCPPGSFCLLARDASHVGHVHLSTIWNVHLRGAIIVAPWLPANVVLVRPDLYITAAWNVVPPSNVIVTELLECLQHPRLRHELRGTVYDGLFGALRVIRPPAVIAVLLLLSLIALYCLFKGVLSHALV